MGELLAGLKTAGEYVPAEYDKLEDLIDFAVQYRYDSFDEDLALNRQETLAQVLVLIKHVEALVSEVEEK